MNLYSAYLDEIEKRKEQELSPKPIEDGALVKELILQIKDSKNKYREENKNRWHGKRELYFKIR